MNVELIHYSFLCSGILVPPVQFSTLSITNSWSLFKLMSIESVMPSNHLILWSSPSPPTFNLSQYQCLFQWVSSSRLVAKVLELQLQHQFFQDGLVGSPCSPRDSQESSPTPQFKSISSSVLSFIVQFSHSYMTTGKTIALTRLKTIALIRFLQYWPP